MNKVLYVFDLKKWMILNFNLLLGILLALR